jgi:hypothetical protein
MPLVRDSLSLACRSLNSHRSMAGTRGLQRGLSHGWPAYNSTQKVSARPFA